MRVGSSLRAVLLVLPALGTAGVWPQDGPKAATSVRMIGPATRLLHLSLPGPNAAAAVETALDAEFIQAGVAPAGPALGLAPLSDVARAESRPERYAIAAVNGDYFYSQGIRQPATPSNALVVGGEVIRTPYPRSCLVLREGGIPEIALLRARGVASRNDGHRLDIAFVNQLPQPGLASLFTHRFGRTLPAQSGEVLVTLQPPPGGLRPGEDCEATVLAILDGSGDATPGPETWCILARNTAAVSARMYRPGDRLKLRFDFDPPIGPRDQVLGGGPRVLRNGVVSVEPEAGSTGETFAQALHPRTAIGFRGRRLVLLTVDGRQPGYSVGMSLQDTARVLADLGCTDGLNMDGGGSTTLWVRGEVVNRPSDGKERPVANGLLLFSTAPVGPPVRLLLDPTELAVLPGAAAPLMLRAEDEHYNPVRLPEPPTWEAPPGLGRVQGGVYFAPPASPFRETRMGELIARSAGLAARAALRAEPAPARLLAEPASLRLKPGGEEAVRVRALDAMGRELLAPPVTWTAVGRAGTVDPDGTFRAGDTPGTGAIEARVGGQVVLVPVTVAERVVRTVDDFEQDTEWTARTSGEGAAGHLATGIGRSGRGLALDYDLRAGKGTRAVYADCRKPLGDAAVLFAWVHGDASGTWLRVKLRDAAGASHLVDLDRRVGWTGWRRLTLDLPRAAPRPFALEAFYVVAVGNGPGPRGRLLFDDLQIELR